ncbi:hypothetical protein EUTSA_v10026773mg [Eutrema salsugineum]|uniref:SWIM-type domain-containing protein n=1 Tax=Eutrema salsugineum TaxID=72664 RepID=V4MJX1_EUTSA|nr:hypothetical protein EUTSA_v10026773mg [Eutrema salsugineum]
MFQIFYGGKFEKYENGTIYYDGGSVQELLTPAASLFESLPVSMYGQTIWYKLPYEGLNELKILCNGVENFQKMCLAAKWTNVVDIYMEADEDSEGNGDDGNQEIVSNFGLIGNGDDGNGERDKEREEEREEVRSDRREEERGVRRDEERDSINGRDEAFLCDEEARVEAVVATFVDEEENDDYGKQTPPTSDNEGEKTEKTCYDRWRRGSGELKVGQVFESVEEFREAVLEYALKGGWNIQYTRWAAKKYTAKCGIDECNWRIYCSYEESVSQWMVKTFQEDHTCYKDGRCKILTESVISDMFIHEIRDDPQLKPKVMQDKIHDRYNDKQRLDGGATDSCAYFSTTSCCEDALNNFSESYNKAIDKARAMPVVQSLETMRRQAMVRIELRRRTTRKHKGKHSLKVGLVIAEEEKEVKRCRSIAGRDNVFEVSERGQNYTVKMKEKTCICRRWDLTGIPCRHVLRVVFDNKKKFKAEDLVSDWYLTSIWKDQYTDSIEPVNGSKFWKSSGEALIKAPPREIVKGRKRKPEKRLKLITESPTKGKKLTNHGRTMHCYRCGLPGHYSIKCPRKPRKPKKSKTSEQVQETMTLGSGEGPAQTQPSQT